MVMNSIVMQGVCASYLLDIQIEMLEIVIVDLRRIFIVWKGSCFMGFSGHLHTSK